MEAIVSRVLPALENNEFDVYYQPQYDYHTRQMCGAEALMRWHCPENGTLLPSKVIPKLEESGLIYEVDKVIWRRVCSDMRQWLDEGYEIDYLSVNISGRDIYGDGFVAYLVSLLTEFRLPASMLHLEITETVSVDDMQFMIQTIQELQRHGFIVEMDDFGSGYSSLKNLKNIPYDRIKIDMDFLQESEINEKAKKILISIIEMMQNLQIPIIVEGVESRSQAELLNRLGCHLMQGYYFGRPKQKSEFQKILKKKQ